MRFFSALLITLALGCGSSHGTGDAGTDAANDPTRVDTGVGRIVTGPPGTCVPGQFGGLECYMGPCPYDCCEDGVLETCFIQTGYECSVVRARDCGGGSCVHHGERCPALCDDPQPFYPDRDGDGVGGGDPLDACEMPAGHSPLGGDCDDDDPGVGALLDDDLEDNDALSLASPLELSRYEGLALCTGRSVTSERDVDFYELPAAPGETRYLRIDVDSGISIAVTQYDASWETVDYSTAAGLFGAALEDSAVIIRVERASSIDGRCSCASYDLELATSILW